MSEPLYTTEILRLAAAAPGAGSLADPQGQAEVRSPTCGSQIRVQVKLNAHGKVESIAQKIESCAFGQASATIMGNDAVGRSEHDVADALEQFEQWLEGLRSDPGSWKGLGALGPARHRRGRHGAMLLPFRALLAAIRDARSRQEG